jgi:hypothetical protein
MNTGLFLDRITGSAGTKKYDVTFSSANHMMNKYRNIWIGGTSRDGVLVVKEVVNDTDYRFK